MREQRRRSARRGPHGEQNDPDGPPRKQIGLPEAKDICLRLLTDRPRTRAELRQALVKCGAEEAVADQALDRLDEVGLIDDKAFAEQWVRSRHTYQGLGRRALAAELRRRGVADEVVSVAADAVDPEAEEERARELVRKKLRSSSMADETTMIRRLVGMLARKGYAQGLAYRVVKDELHAFGTETELLDIPD